MVEDKSYELILDKKLNKSKTFRIHEATCCIEEWLFKKAEFSKWYWAMVFQKSEGFFLPNLWVSFFFGKKEKEKKWWGLAKKSFETCQLHSILNYLNIQHYFIINTHELSYICSFNFEMVIFLKVSQWTA